jgi:poly(A) polymerase
MTEREFAIDVVRKLKESGYEALWAGGCVRDELLGRKPKDYDVATSALPEQVRRLFRRTVAVGISFGVIEVLGPKDAGEPLQVEVATFRSDVSYSDGRHPDRVVFSTAREDALRRDFTINGMFFDPVAAQLIDYVGGQKDLQDKVLRAIGDPTARFAEDKLRMLRAIRIAACFDLVIDRATQAAIPPLAGHIKAISAERVRDELRRLLVDPHRSRGLNLMYETGLVAPIMPELLEMKGLPHGRPHAPTGDLWDHVMQVLDLLGPDISFTLALAALLHDIGKRRTMGRTPDRYTFYYHEDVGCRMAHEICLRLKLSNRERERVEWLVKKHQYLCNAPKMRPSKLKQVLGHPGVDELLALHRADALATGTSTDHVQYCEQLLKKWSQEDLNPDPLLTGNDLQEAMRLQPGPRFKQLLDEVREAQLDGTITTKEQALDLVKRLLHEKTQSPEPLDSNG